MGSAPNIAAVAIPSPHHPSSQGFVQALGVFIDTILICTATGVMILMSDALQPGSGVTGTVLTQHAMAYHIGDHGKDFVALAVFFFAFTSIIGNYSYAEGALTYLKIDNKVNLVLLRSMVLVFIVWGGVRGHHHGVRCGRCDDGHHGDHQPGGHRDAVRAGGEADPRLLRAAQAR